MNHVFTRRMSRSWLIALIGFCLLITTLVAAQQTRVSAKGPHERVVTVYDGSKEQTFVTKAETVEEALKRAKIELSKHDAVEPHSSTELVASNYSINVYRARPVVVVDGERRINVMSPHKSARQVAQKAGIELDAEDEVVIERVNNIDTAAIAAQKVTVERATPFTLVLYGQKAEVRTQATTVADFIATRGIELGSNDGMSVGLYEPMVSGMVLEIWRDGTQTVTEEKEVAFGVRQIQDKDRELGYKQLKTAGQNGKKVVTFEVEMKNGKEVSRKEIQSVVTVQPVEQIEVVGAKQPAVYSGSHSDWMRAAGIPESDWVYVDHIVRRESGWNPRALNPSSGACGLAQALPCSKVPGDWSNPVDSLRWQHGYVKGRYGGYAQAYQFWQANHWY